MGAKMVQQVAKKTADVAGDGTTSATILADAIFVMVYGMYRLVRIQLQYNVASPPLQK